MPSLNDMNFHKSVVYIYEHSTEGAMGFVLNKPLNVKLGIVLDHLGIPATDSLVAEEPVLMGGPVGQEHGFVLHDSKQEKDRLCVSATKEVLVDILENKGPDNYVVTLGYSGWEANQLEEEISCNDWLVVPYMKEILFETPVERRWFEAAKILGIDINHLSNQVGHV